MTTSPHERKLDWVYDLLLIVVLLVGAYFRLVGLNWDEGQHPHPDERFLTMVETALQPKVCADASVPLEACPPEQKRWMSARDYFNTAKSTLNPHNRGYGFFVYGTLPMFIVRYVAEWSGQTGYDQVNLVGRLLSALADLGTLVLLYFIAARVYNRRVGLLAAAFSSLAVMQIQQSHFWTTDNFTTFFMFLALYFAVEIAFGENREKRLEISKERGTTLSFLFSTLSRILRDPLLWLSLAFGFTLGMALASKINAIVLAVVLPAALFIRYSNQCSVFSIQSRDEKLNTEHWTLNTVNWSLITVYLITGALAALLAFRLFQPYAFSGPGFFGLKPNPEWIADIREQRSQASGDADVPFALQWARRSHLYSFENLTVWGLGLPLGILAWAGFLWMGWRILPSRCCAKGEWKQHALLWGWTAAYFLWQSIQFNPTMRYQLPIYPLLAMMASYFVFQVAGLRLKVKRANPDLRPLTFNLQPLAILLGSLVLVATAGWALAFTSIYTRTETRLAASRWIYQNIPGPINLRLQIPDGTTYRVGAVHSTYSAHNQPLPFHGTPIQPGLPFETAFFAQRDGILTDILLAHVADRVGAAHSTGTRPATLSLSLALAPNPTPEQILATASLTTDFTPTKDLRGEAYTLMLNRPVAVTKGQTYFLRLENTDGALTLSGAAVANETDWDLGLPFRTEYDGFGGIYQGGLNFQVYWPDNAEKLARFTDTLNQADYIFIPSNHQFSQIVRLPERYPLTTVYYRELLGCPPEKEIIWCYNLAQPGDFQGNLGYDLAAVFESYPTLGPLVINDQFAEEAFTIYDHAKVFIFQKRADYDPLHVAALLGAVDTSHVVHLTPKQAGSYKDLMLPTDRLAVQQAGGTWSELFDYQALQNRYPLIGLALWYLTLFVLGLFAYPFVRMALPGLADRGYPLARIAGLLLWAWLSWLAGSLGLTYNRAVIGIAFGAVALIGATLAYRQRAELSAEWKSKRKYFLIVEGLFLAFFLLDLFIRLGNPDLWHAVNGGERPMNFSYFNAVLKSTTFPPYDPWFAGGYINYYYFGYVIVGTPVKLLGIVPSIAYNFILPTLFAILAMGAFSVGWNLVNKDEGGRHALSKVEGLKAEKFILHPSSFIPGLAASSAMVLLGNLGILRLFYRGFMCSAAPSARIGFTNIHDCIIAPGGLIDKASIFERIWWTVKGFFMSLSGLNLPLPPRDWFWWPSRALPFASGDPITEFPLFTFLWSDLHAHMIAFSLTVLVIAWALSLLLAKGRWKSRLDAFLGLFLGGLVIGALKPTNTWDFYTYLALGALVLFYTLVRYADVERLRLPLPGWGKRLLLAAGAAVALVAVGSLLLYQPFSQWFAQAYNTIEPWKGGRSNISSYLVHWGVFLFFIVSWMVWETRQWLAETPLSALRKLRPYRDLIYAALLLILLALILQQAWVMSSSQNVPWKGVTVLWLALPLAVWAAVLIFRPGISDGKRLILFMVGTSLLLTMVVEIIVLRGDVGRMNTVFKFYVQAWIMLGISAAAAFGWLLVEIPQWLPRWRTAWNVTAAILVSCAALFLLVVGMVKIRDRMNPAAPHGLDSMTYMAYAHYADFGVDMDLSQDYRAIRWMQENVQGSPVIVEANVPEYRWGTRFTI
ncbi:MAG: glycosyltransferase family 39 protein, partial [Chloroflexi bacterium]|nr:glycosyltransferase family 39 protein [Chloroflexota bacterium]